MFHLNVCSHIRDQDPVSIPIGKTQIQVVTILHAHIVILPTKAIDPNTKNIGIFNKTTSINVRKNWRRFLKHGQLPINLQYNEPSLVFVKCIPTQGLTETKEKNKI